MNKSPDGNSLKAAEWNSENTLFFDDSFSHNPSKDYLTGVLEH